MDLVKSSLDEKILANARKSHSEIALLTGLDAAYVAERLAALLDAPDYLSDRQEERLLLLEAAAFKDKMNDILDGYSMEAGDAAGIASLGNVVLRSMKLIAERLDSRRKLVDEDINKITEAHAKVFAQAFDLALQHIVMGFRAFDGVPSDEEIDILVEDGLRKASRVLSANLS